MDYLCRRNQRATWTPYVMVKTISPTMIKMRQRAGVKTVSGVMGGRGVRVGCGVGDAIGFWAIARGVSVGGVSVATAGGARVADGCAVSGVGSNVGIKVGVAWSVGVA